VECFCVVYWIIGGTGFNDRVWLAVYGCRGGSWALTDAGGHPKRVVLWGGKVYVRVVRVVESTTFAVRVVWEGQVVGWARDEAVEPSCEQEEGYYDIEEETYEIGALSFLGWGIFIGYLGLASGLRWSCALPVILNYRNNCPIILVSCCPSWKCFHSPFESAPVLSSTSPNATTPTIKYKTSTFGRCSFAWESGSIESRRKSTGDI